MTDVFDEPGWARGRRTLARLSAALTNAARATGPPLLFGLRLWASVCLALYVAFWLELDNPFWAGTSAAIVCQPQLGASLRKGWYRMIGTFVGAGAIVVLTAWFPQDRALFLVALALWAAACALVATLLPDAAEPLQRSQLMAALAVGSEIIQLRRIATRLGLGSDLDAALEALARGNSAIATTRLSRLDDRLAALSGAGSDASLALQARGSILAISEALIEHASYFDAGAPG
jgi:hypothetical protein